MIKEQASKLVATRTTLKYIKLEPFFKKMHPVNKILKEQNLKKNIIDKYHLNILASNGDIMKIIH